jgi:hypothetical protein
MAHWGIAMTLFQPLWPTRPGPEDLRRGWQEIQSAQAIGGVTDRERGFIAAASEFFDPDRSDYWDRINRWADAMRALHEAYPNDIEAKAFFALSHLATAPVTGELSHQEYVAPLLAQILAGQPTHPGAVHYTIHANDATGREGESLDVVKGYGAIAPRNPHALHMPTHIQTRLGEWPGVVDGNREAAQAALENPAGDRQQWVWDEFPHAIEYEVYALLQLGDDGAALSAMNRLERTPNLEPTFKTAFHLSSIPARYALERREWKRAAMLEPRPNAELAWELFPWPEAVTWFARGLGSVRSNDLAGAREAEARIAQLEQISERLGEQLFTRQTEILRLDLEAWIAFAAGEAEQAIRFAEQAVALEASTPKPPVTPAPTLPASELFADLLLALDRPEAALAAYRSTLEQAPRRFNSVAGAARAARAMGDRTLAAQYYRELLEMVVSDSPRPEVTEARAFLTMPAPRSSWPDAARGRAAGAGRPRERAVPASAGTVFAVRSAR